MSSNENNLFSLLSPETKKTNSEGPKSQSFKMFDFKSIKPKQLFPGKDLFNSPQNTKTQKNTIKEEDNSYSPYVKVDNKLSTNLSHQKSNDCITNFVYKTAKKNNVDNKFYSPSVQNAKSEKLSDRFIPLNKGINLMEKFNLAKKFEFTDENQNPLSINNNDNNANDNTNDVYSHYLKQNVFKENNPFFDMKFNNNSDSTDSALKSNIFSFKSDEKPKTNFIRNITETQKENMNSLNLIVENNRKINPKPYKILPAQKLMDDFYLNLLDWSTKNQIAVGCTTNVVLWSVNKTKSETLLSYDFENFSNFNMSQSSNEMGPKYVSSLIFSKTGDYLAVGNSKGFVELWDVNEKKMVTSFGGHSSRVGVVSMYDNIISSGSKDCLILTRDIRCKDNTNNTVMEFRGHSQEVCGLKWSFDGTQLASGGNDNNLMIWNLHSNKPLMVSANHSAAVKAIAWSPHHHNLLASGGGTADRTIRFWNTSSMTQINKYDTGSQVCNLVFSKTSNELVSTHGFSLNQINLWKVPSMTKVATLIGHTFRVLYLGLSPNGQNIVTGAGDETLRFWNLLPPYKTDLSSSLFPSNHDLR